MFSTKANHGGDGVSQEQLHFLAGSNGLFPRQIRSDNAKNFVGTKYELIELNRRFLRQDHRRVFASFIELITSRVNNHIYRAIGLAVFGFEELRTLLCHIVQPLIRFPLYRFQTILLQVQVQVKDENLLSTMWALARILELTPGRDGVNWVFRK